MQDYPFDIKKIQLEQPALVTSNIVSYLVNSNAPISVETIYKENTNAQTGDDTSQPQKTDETIKEIANFLLAHQEKAEIIIHIHGYNTGEKDFEDWTKNIYQYILNDKFISQKTLVFIGYRWPSESIALKADEDSESFLNNVAKAIQSLPIFFRTVLDSSLRGIIVSFTLLLIFLIPFTGTALLLNNPSFLASLLVFVTAFFTFLFGFVFSAILLRSTIYFRDSYRAVNYGVPDLVELIRQIDNAIVEESDKSERVTIAQKQEKLSQTFANSNSGIKLSFMCHSMGAFVTTNVIRILSDVFDEKSIQTQHSPENQPSLELGNAFSLGRLVLASPDIPIETIMPERSNVLRSSIRRFEESYLFSNQGDFMLRVASTAANYLSFPANTYDRGFRLGNVVVRDYDESYDSYSLNAKLLKQDIEVPKLNFGIANQNPRDGSINQNPNSAMKCICIVSDNRYKPLDELYSKNTPVTQKLAVAGLFTYFDCTNYKDVTNNNDQVEPILTRALDKEVLSFWDNLFLIFDNLFLGRNVHGGYFDGKLSQKILYRLAFLGFKDMLFSLEDETDCQELVDKLESQISPKLIQESLQSQTVEPDAEKLTKLLSVLSQKCNNVGIKAFLAPERYQVDILGKPRDRKDY
ncbi:alpha/beta hydrolase [Calothrix sp. UHCC 0171]|uniref:alpha/beta hydrolase n=1 Tax=Calothrix sp. UHCC 0171 TaxID=3110245 RepID=UPI002B216A24|nr:alpha/beta hydrolase [Calothrix sp. UHCC 0171]MEA5574564.1 alpha/beta hydrolase [Calothrix sp. UHCC 0171]